MANEAEIINNPDSTPGAVSTGYQLQNTNLVSQRTGIDKTYVSGGVGTATVEISGPVDVNGVLYDIKTQTVLTPPSAGRYYITLQGAGPQYLTPTLGTSAGTFDPLKNARYDASNYRVLNWVIYFDGTDCYANRLLTPESEHTEIKDLDSPEETWITTTSNWIAPRSKYYTIYVTGRGGDGGISGGTPVPRVGGGGLTGIKRIWIDAGDTWTATMNTGSGAYTTFSDGVTTISCQNGFDGKLGDPCGGTLSSGADVCFQGGHGVGIGGSGIGGASYYTAGAGPDSNGGNYGGGAGPGSALSTTIGGPGAVRIIG